MGQIFVQNLDFYAPPALDAAVNFNVSEYAINKGIQSCSDGDVALEKVAGCCT